MKLLSRLLQKNKKETSADDMLNNPNHKVDGDDPKEKNL